MVRQLVNDTYLNPCSSLKGCLRPPGQRVTSRQLNNIKRVRKTLELISIYTPCTVKPAGQRKIPSKPREPWRSGGVFEPTPLLNWESKKIQAPSKSFASTNRARTHKPTISKSTSTPTTRNSTSTPTTSKSTSIPTTSKSTSTPTTRKSASNPTTSKSASNPTTRKSTSTPTTSKSTYTPTTRKSTSTPTTSKSTYTPTTRKSTSTPTTSKSTYTPTTSKSTSTPTTRKSSSTPTTRKPSSTPTTIKSSSTPTISKSSSTPTISKSSSTPTTRKSTSTPTTSKPSSTPTTSKSSSTPTTSKSTFPSTTKRFRSTERKSFISAPALAMNYCKPTKKLSTNTTKFICPSEKKVYSSIPAPKLTEHPPKTSKHLTNTTKVIRSSEKNISPSVPARGLIPRPSTVNKPANKTTKLEHNTTRSIRSSTTKMNFNPPATLNNNHLPVGNKFSLTKTSPVTRNQIKTVQSSASNRTTTRGPRQSYHQQPATKLSTHTPLTLRTSMKTNLISTRKIASQTGPQIQHCLQTTRTPYQLFIGDSRLYHSSMKNTTSTSRRSKPATLPRKSIASKPPFMF